LVEGLFDEIGIFDTTPFSKYLANFNNMTSARSVFLGVVDANNGTFTGFNTEGLSREEIISLVVASNAAPFFYPYVMYGGIPYMDGSVINTFDDYDPIDYCRSQGFADSNIVVDVILTSSSSNVTKEDFTTGTAFGMGLRGLQLLLWEDGYDDMFHLLIDYPNIDLRYVVMPSQDLKQQSNFPYDFTAAEIQDFINIGIQDGAKAVTMGQKACVETAKKIFMDHHAKFYRNGRQTITK